MDMKKLIALICALSLVLCAAAASAVTIAVPNDPTNEGRALLLLQAQGVIKLKEDAGITATKADIAENPLGIEFEEVEAAMVPNVLADVDFGIINGNYALAAQILDKALLFENSESPYVNVVSVKAENVDTPEAKALAAAVLSQQVVDFFATYTNGAIATIDNPTDGYDPDVDYGALAGSEIIIAATPAPHAQILEVVKEILAAKDITLKIEVFTGYTEENPAVDAGDVYANYFQHQPYLDDQVSQEGYDVVSVGTVHTEPMGLYGSQQKDLSALGK